MMDLGIIARRALMQAGATSIALTLACEAWAQTATAPAPSASSTAAAEKAQRAADRTLYWIRVLADKPATKPAPAAAPTAAAIAAKPAPAAPTPAQRPAPAETPRVAQNTAPATIARAGAPAATPAETTAANSLGLGARGTPEPTPSAGSVSSATAGGFDAGAASPAVGGGIAAPALAAPTLDVPPIEADEPDAGLSMVSSVDPEFPMNLMRRLRKGEVEVRFDVAADGQVEAVSVERSTHRGLDAAALQAVRQWRFKPGSRGHTALVVLAFNMDA